MLFVACSSLFFAALQVLPLAGVLFASVLLADAYRFPPRFPDLQAQAATCIFTTYPCVCIYASRIRPVLHTPIDHRSSLSTTVLRATAVCQLQLGSLEPCWPMGAPLAIQTAVWCAAMWMLDVVFDACVGVCWGCSRVGGSHKSSCLCCSHIATPGPSPSLRWCAVVL